MITRKLLFAALGAMAVASAGAAPLTPGQALQRARGNSKIAKMAARAASSAKPAFIKLSANGKPAAYVFNDASQGYMILSADDVAYPILGYSDSGKIDVNNMSPELKWMLDEYARQIEWAVSVGAEVAKVPEAPEGWAPIAPQLKTKWNQDAPYNNDCPLSNDKRTYTGCVATSMAQVMKYHKYPEKGEGIIKYYCTTLKRNLTLNLERQNFDWDNMLDNYISGQYSETEADAVSYLMKACGFAVEMGYGLNASGAQGINIATGLVKYMKYDKNCRAERRMFYSATEWNKMMYDNLKNIGPVIINGQSPSEGGHSFVCDGYDGKGYYHINWGWGGVSDGYYALEALNPEAQGIGSYAGGYNFSQCCIFGIQPPTGSTENLIKDGLMQYGTTTGTINGRHLSLTATNYSPLGWSSASGNALNVNVGVIIEPLNGGEKKYVQGKLRGNVDVNLPNGYAYIPPSSDGNFEADLPELINGKYKVILASKTIGEENAQWEPCMVAWGLVNYVNLEVNGSTYTVTDVTPSTIQMSDLTVVSPVYDKSNVHLSIKATNSSDIELTQGICPMLRDANGRLVFSGQSLLITLNPGESREVQWSCRFQPQTGAPTITGDTDFTLVLRNPETNQLYKGIEIPVVMHKSVGTTFVSAVSPVIQGMEKGEYQFGERTFQNVYFIPSYATPFEFDFGVECSRGYADGQITVTISAPDIKDTNIIYPVVDELMKDTPFLQRGEKAEYNVKVDFPEGEINKLYYLNVQYTSGSNVRNLTRQFFVCTNNEGVDGILADPSQVEYYNLQGIRIDAPRKGEMVIMKAGNKSYKVIYK